MEEQRENRKIHIGLTKEQVQAQIKAGFVNGELETKTKSYLQILKDNLFSLFNLVNLILVLCILISGSIKNALFFLVVIWNFLIGTIQEIRAKKTIEKLSLLSAPKVTVLRDGTIQEIQTSGIVLGEIMQLKNGNQVCADAVVIDGSCQVNESLITGESEPIDKRTGDHLISGSFLVSGRVLAEAEHIGKDNYVSKITLGAKYFKKSESVIMHSVKSIVRVVALLLIPLAALLVWNNFFRIALPFTDAMVKTVASVSSMIPGGLVLLVSIMLAVSVVRLSVHHTLVQDLYCVENLARVDMLLLDKTGTITEGILTVYDLILLCDEPGPLISSRDLLSRFPGETLPAKLRHALRFYFDHSTDENSTAEAIRNYLAGYKDPETRTSLLPEKENVTFVPFSSERKYSLLKIPGKGSLLLGAPEYLLGDRIRVYQEQLTEFTDAGKRALLFAFSGEISERPDYESVNPLAFLVLSDRIRESAPETFDFFEKEGVTIKVISGDHPLTVSRTAADAGLPDARNWVDASLIREEELDKAAETYTVFGRVSPMQKLRIVKALKKSGHTVAMTGDGANDVLALKEADCSIAMQAGSDAARTAANIVLLNSDFSSLPLVLAEGRKSINNLQRSAGLYLTKTVYSLILAVVFLVTTQILYPFENIQITLIGAVTIGIPSFFLALEPNHERVKTQFLKNVFRISLPTGFLEAVSLVVLLSVLNRTPEVTALQCASAATCLMLINGILAVFNICGKLNLWKACLIFLLAAVAAGAALLLPGVFSLVSLTFDIWKILLITAAAFLILHGIWFRVILPLINRRHS